MKNDINLIFIILFVIAIMGAFWGSEVYGQEFPTSSDLKNVQTEIAELAVLEAELDSLKILVKVFERGSDYWLDIINIKLSVKYDLYDTKYSGGGGRMVSFTIPAKRDKELLLEFTMTDNQVRELFKQKVKVKEQEIIDKQIEIRKRLGIK